MPNLVVFSSRVFKYVYIYDLFSFISSDIYSVQTPVNPGQAHHPFQHPMQQAIEQGAWASFQFQNQRPQSTRFGTMAGTNPFSPTVAALITGASGLLSASLAPSVRVQYQRAWARYNSLNNKFQVQPSFPSKVATIALYICIICASF